MLMTSSLPSVTYHGAQPWPLASPWLLQCMWFIKFSIRSQCRLPGVRLSSPPAQSLLVVFKYSTCNECHWSPGWWQPHPLLVSTGLGLLSHYTLLIRDCCEEALCKCLLEAFHRTGYPVVLNMVIQLSWVKHKTRIRWIPSSISGETFRVLGKVLGGGLILCVFLFLAPGLMSCENASGGSPLCTQHRRFHASKRLQSSKPRQRVYLVQSWPQWPCSWGKGAVCYCEAIHGTC